MVSSASYSLTWRVGASGLMLARPVVYARCTLAAEEPYVVGRTAAPLKVTSSRRNICGVCLDFMTVPTQNIHTSCQLRRDARVVRGGVWKGCGRTPSDDEILHELETSRDRMLLGRNSYTLSEHDSFVGAQTNHDL